MIANPSRFMFAFASALAETSNDDHNEFEA